MHPAPSLSEAFPKTNEVRSSKKRPASPMSLEPALQRPGSHTPSASPPLRKNTTSSTTTSATATTEATITSPDTAVSPYSAEPSPSFPRNQAIFSAKDGTDLSHRRNTRRRTGPLSATQREKAALIRRIGACADCKRRRVGCIPEHHGMSTEEAVRKHKMQSPPPDPPQLVGRHISPAPLSSGRLGYPPEPREMDVDPTPTLPVPRSAVSMLEARNRTPLPTGPTNRTLERMASAALPNIPNIDTLRPDMATSTRNVIGNPYRSRYTAGRVLAFAWQDDPDPSVASHLEGLGRVLRDTYSYTFEIERIPSASQDLPSPHRWMTKRLTEFVDDRERRDVLKIVVYSGDSYLDANRDMVLAMSGTRDSLSARSTIRWDGLQTILEQTSSDTLILMDAAYYPSPRMSREGGVLEFVAASASDGHFRELGRHTFTRTITDLLRSRAQMKYLKPFSAAELHAKLVTTYPSLIKDRTPEQETITSFPIPLHIQVCGSVVLPSIQIAPLSRTTRPYGAEHDSGGAHINLTIRLHNDPVDQDNWIEWIRAMPAGIKDVQMDVPHRNTFR